MKLFLNFKEKNILHYCLIFLSWKSLQLFVCLVWIEMLLWTWEASVLSHSTLKVLLWVLSGNIILVFFILYITFYILEGPSHPTGIVPSHPYWQGRHAPSAWLFWQVRSRTRAFSAMAPALWNILANLVQLSGYLYYNNGWEMLEKITVVLWLILIINFYSLTNECQTSM